MSSCIQVGFRGVNFNLFLWQLDLKDLVFFILAQYFFDLSVCELFEADQGLTHVRISELEHDVDEWCAWGVLVYSVNCHFRDELND